MSEVGEAMRVLVACVRGNVAERDRFGHCLCDACKAYRSAKQRERGNAKRRAWARAHPDRVREYSRKWVLLNKEKRQAAVIAWRLRNPEKVAEISSRAGKKWASANRGKRNASVKARQLAKRQRVPAWADKEKIAEIYAEAQRLTLETGIPHEVDHILPLQGKTVSGLHVHTNLRVITRRENRSKQNRMEESCAF